MKFLLLLILISSSAMANYIPKSKVGIDIPLTVWLNNSKCEKKYSEPCLKIDSKYNSNYSILIDEEIDDTEKPVNSKTIVNECGEYCQTLFENDYRDYECEDSEEKLILNLDSKQIYCSKFLRYEKKLSGKKIIGEDEMKKSTYMANKLKKSNREAKIRKGQEKRIKSERALAYLAGYNEDMGRTEAEIDAFELAFAEIDKQLNKKRTKKAKRLIEEITDENYAELKSELLEILE